MSVNEDKEAKTTEIQNTSPRAGSPSVSSDSLTRGQSLLGYFATMLASVSMAVIVTLVVLPFFLGTSPLDLYGGNFLGKSTSKTIIKAGGADSLVAAIAKKVTPSVVTIEVYQNKANDLFTFPFAESEEQPSKPDAMGSGIIYREDGYIITNNHVVKNAKKVDVIIGESTKVAAKIVGTDPQEDIALVKVNKSSLEAAEIGSAEKLEVGDLAVAIGSPFQLQHTVTSGIISAKNRVTSEESDWGSPSKTLTDLIQTDAAINPGNSGGALVNAKGQIVGINTLIESTSGSSAGIGFAIPIERAVSIAKQIISKGKVSHPYIGVSVVDSKKVKLPNLAEGVFVQDVMVGGPAYKAGIKAGDVITKARGKKVKTSDALITIIKRSKVGSKLTITYVREKVTKETLVVLADKPSNLE